ncbi:uncharacterized [Tachysurus ichikawai]
MGHWVRVPSDDLSDPESRTQMQTAERTSKSKERMISTRQRSKRTEKLNSVLWSFPQTGDPPANKVHRQTELTDKKAGKDGEKLKTETTGENRRDWSDEEAEISLAN